MRKKSSEKVFDVINILLFLIISFMFIYPFYRSIIISLNDGADASRGGLYFWPRIWTLDNYIAVFKNPNLLNAYIITVLRTLVGTVTSVIATGMFAYGLSKKDLLFRKFYLSIATFTMFFSGGLIPTFILIKGIGLIDSFWVYIIPALISIWNMMIMKTFFQNTPEALEESAKIDGYNELQIFFKIILPISAPIFATIALFNGVAQWNAWFDASIYITNQKLLPLQTILVKLITQHGAAQDLNRLLNSERALAEKVTTESLKTATMVVSIGPIILIYPFLQKYFMKGIMLGSIKE